ncbi:hypothetical protein K435DRAFT_853802 [Dendrothele bispora CBS 962.96]|uniref:Cyclase n=1 Tax=Dendrothele bispora (strain CBS 962.96) TaxID=1314807 RepID=A0A4S8MFG3_DENBC|nr:hypothetical protein K435DRAFT_853802 [Dendrothele bispora CBS 962.96]
MFPLKLILSSLALLRSYSLVRGTPISDQQILAIRQFNNSDIYANWPTYDQLPLDPSFPTKSAWGVWLEGADDELGALNHIRPETIKAALAEVQHGIAINLNLDLDVPHPPLVPSRTPLMHTFLAGEGYQDDIVTLNTQISTQYDGLRHVPYSTDANISTFYNNLLTFEDIFSAEGVNTLGIQNAAEKGIAGRAVLLDWAGWMESRNEPFDTLTSRSITVDELDLVAQWQGLDPSTFSHPGDFLIIRTGFTKQYSSLPQHEQMILPYREAENATFLGIETSDRTLAWIWEKKISLVGADNLAFETFPFNGTVDGVQRSLHEVFLSGWGQSIVELLDLEKLTETCHSLGKFSFFFTIQVLNVLGGVASPPNALAIL